MSLDKINATLANATSTTAPKASTGKRGFTVPQANNKLKADAKGWVAAYDKGIANGKFPRVGFSASSSNFLPMVIVAMVAGFTTEADAIAKVRAVQVALGVRPTDRNNLGLKAMASPSAVVREKTMRSLAVDWIAKADAKGVYKLAPTRPSERVAARAIRPETAKANGKATVKAKANGKATVAPKAKAERANGPVTSYRDPAIAKAARKAERLAARQANNATAKATIEA